MILAEVSNASLRYWQLPLMNMKGSMSIAMFPQTTCGHIFAMGRTIQWFIPKHLLSIQGL